MRCSHDEHQRENLGILGLQIAEKFIFDTLSDCRSLACTSFVCSSSDSYQNFKIFMGSFMRLSFITQFKIEFLVLFTCCRKVLAKMPAFKPFSKLEITSVNIEHQVKSKLAWPISTKVKCIKNTDDTALIYVFKRIK